MSQQKRRFSSRPIIYIFAGAAALLTVISVISVLEVKNIETKLEQEIFTLLAQSGFAAPNIEIDGRNIIFSGTVDAIVDRQKMVAIVQELSGVETVVDQRDVINFTSARHFTLNSYAGITTVEGELPDKTDVRLIEAAIRNHYGVDPLGANLRITPSVKRPEWLDDFPAILAEALNVLAAYGWESKETAGALGCSSSQLVKLLKLEPQAFVELNRRRGDLGLKPLK